MAMEVAEKFSVITVLPTSANEIEEHIRMYGFSCRLASIRSANVPVLGLEDESVAEEHIYAAAKLAVEQDGAQAIVLGCTGMMAMRSSLERRLGVPVIEPYSAAIQIAAGLVRMGLRQSRLSYVKGGQKVYN
ncbi:MAG: aspartate/glutamate racemase family protein [Oscillibacter sp.]|jgi:allantoin racemase|nr:aspartate/glutamate racemase family protein [Oscillibacter sp.]